MGDKWEFSNELKVFIHFVDNNDTGDLWEFFPEVEFEVNLKPNE